MKEMKYLQFSLDLVLDKMAEDDTALFNVPLTCLEEGSEMAVKEAIRDSLGGEIVNSDKEYYVRIYFVDVNKTPQRVISRFNQHCLKGVDIAQWALERLPLEYGTFALMLRPKEAPMDVKLRRVWLFMMR